MWDSHSVTLPSSDRLPHYVGSHTSSCTQCCLHWVSRYPDRDGMATVDMNMPLNMDLGSLEAEICFHKAAENKTKKNQQPHHEFLAAGSKTK